MRLGNLFPYPRVTIFYYGFKVVKYSFEILLILYDSTAYVRTSMNYNTFYKQENTYLGLVEKSLSILQRKSSLETYFLTNGEHFDLIAYIINMEDEMNHCSETK